MSILWRDLVYGIRILGKKPLFTLVIALSLAVGIGLNTAIFTVMNAILLRSLPFPDAERLVTLVTIPPGHPDQPNGASVPELFAWKEQARSFEAIGALTNNAVDFGAEENGVPAERIQGENVTPGLLRALGAQPLIGRLFTESEDEVDHPAAVILISHRLWMRRFGGAKDILNRNVLVNGVSTAIIGVMGPDFRITDETGDYVAPVPLNHFQLRGSARFLLIAARLKPGVTMKQAQSEMDAIAGQLAKQFPARETDQGKPWTVRMQTYRDGIFGFIGRPLLLLQGAVGFVLLIACANVAALLMARASARQTEVAIRAALGAGRGRIFRQFLTESLLLSILSGVLGVFLAWGVVRVLVAGQLALALTLLIGSGLLIRSFLQLQGANLGCEPHGLLTFRYRFPEKRFGKPVGVYHGLPLWELSGAPQEAITRVFERLQSVLGLRSVAGTVYPPPHWE